MAKYAYTVQGDSRSRYQLFRITLPALLGSGYTNPLNENFMIPNRGELPFPRPPNLI